MVDLVDGVARVTGKVDCGYVLVDGSSIGDVTEDSLKDRRVLGEEGFISVIVVIDSQTGRVVSGPEIHARGLAEDDAALEEITGPIVAALDKPSPRASTTPTSCSRPSAGWSAGGPEGASDGAR